MWDVTLKTGQSFRSGARRETGGTTAQSLVHVIETLSWGDAGIYLCGPGAGLGGAAIEATGTAEQKQRFLTRYREGAAEVGLHGHDGGALRIRHRGHPHHRRARRRELGPQRGEDLRHHRPQGAGRLRRA